MNRILPIIAFIFAANFLFAQQNMPLPSVWLKADSAYCTENEWQNQIADENHATFSAEIIPYQSNNFNYNPSISIDSGHYFTVLLNTLFSQGGDVIIVYETNDSLAENGLWCLENDSLSVGLTSQQIVNHEDFIRYRTDNQKYGIIHYLATSWSDDFCSPATSLKIGSADSLFLNGKIAEVLYFDHRQQDTVVNQWCSYLAIKYGVTLIKTNYLTSNKNCVWNYDEFPTYSHCIAGMGRDDSLGLHQKQSYFAHKKISVGLGAIANSNEENSFSLQNNDFIIMGMDENGLETLTPLYLPNGETHLTVGNTKVQVTQNMNSEYSTFLHLQSPDFLDTTLICALLIDRSGTGNYPISETEIYYPSTSDSSTIQYNNIVWDSDGNGHDVFCFTILGLDSLPAQNLNFKSIENQNSIWDELTVNRDENAVFRDETSEIWGEIDGYRGKIHEAPLMQYQIYPNPTQEEFTIDITLSTAASVTIKLWNSEGKLMKKWEQKSAISHKIHHNISISGTYFVEIISENKQKTLKLIVN